MTDDHIADTLGIRSMADLEDEDTDDQLPMERPSGDMVISGEDRDHSNTEKLDTDFQYARENLYGVIEQGQNALSDLLELARQSQNPRSFEVVADLIRTLSTSSKDLIDIQQRLAKIKEEGNQGSGNKGGTTNNNMFVGSAAELVKAFGGKGRDLLKNLQDAEEGEVIDGDIGTTEDSSSEER